MATIFFLNDSASSNALPQLTSESLIDFFYWSRPVLMIVFAVWMFVSVMLTRKHLLEYPYSQTRGKQLGFIFFTIQTIILIPIILVLSLLKQIPSSGFSWNESIGLGIALQSYTLILSFVYLPFVSLGRQTDAKGKVLERKSSVSYGNSTQVVRHSRKSSLSTTMEQFVSELPGVHALSKTTDKIVTTVTDATHLSNLRIPLLDDVIRNSEGFIPSKQFELQTTMLAFRCSLDCYYIPPSLYNQYVNQEEERQSEFEDCAEVSSIDVIDSPGGQGDDDPHVVANDLVKASLICASDFDFKSLIMETSRRGISFHECITDAETDTHCTIFRSRRVEQNPWDRESHILNKIHDFTVVAFRGTNSTSESIVDYYFYVCRSCVDPNHYIILK